MYYEKNTEQFDKLKSKLNSYELIEDDEYDEKMPYEINIKSVIATYFDDSNDIFPENFILSHHPTAGSIGERKDSTYLFGNAKIYQFYLTDDDYIGGLELYDLQKVKDVKYKFRFDKSKISPKSEYVYAEKPEIISIELLFENNTFLILSKNAHNKKRFKEIKEYIFKYIN